MPITRAKKSAKGQATSSVTNPIQDLTAQVSYLYYVSICYKLIYIKDMPSTNFKPSIKPQISRFLSADGSGKNLIEIQSSQVLFFLYPLIFHD